MGISVHCHIHCQTSVIPTIKQNCPEMENYGRTLNILLTLHNEYMQMNIDNKKRALLSNTFVKERPSFVAINMMLNLYIFLNLKI